MKTLLTYVLLLFGFLMGIHNSVFANSDGNLKDVTSKHITKSNKCNDCHRNCAVIDSGGLGHLGLDNILDFEEEEEDERKFKKQLEKVSAVSIRILSPIVSDFSIFQGESADTHSAIMPDATQRCVLLQVFRL